MITLAIVLTAATLPASAPLTRDEIVVTARPGKCEVVMGEHPVSDREFNQLAKQWAVGRPVRVIKPRGADDRCLTKIMFKLARKGVTAAEFVDRADDR